MSGNRGVPGASEATRIELLRIGAEIVRERGHSPRIGVRLSEVVARAGRTTGSAYQVWKSQEAYQRELARYLAENVDYSSAEVLRSAVEQALGSGDDLLALVASAGEFYFRLIVSGNEFYVSLFAWTSLDALPAETEQAKIGAYERVQEEFEAFFGAVFAGYGHSPDPDELKAMTTMVTAMTEGLALRYRFSADDVERERVIQTYVRFLVMLAERATQA